MMQIRQILAPTDFSECSKQAVACAYELAQAFGAKLVLLHVVEELPSYIGFIPPGGAAMLLRIWSARPVLISQRCCQRPKLPRSRSLARWSWALHLTKSSKSRQRNR